MARFVNVKNPAYSSLGTAKVVELGATEATVSWFDSPLSDPFVESVPRSELQAVRLERQTRVYWLDRDADTWRVGRVLDADDTLAQVRFANSQDYAIPLRDLEVRWDRPIEDPSAFLAEQINESPVFVQARSAFARSLIAQRGACSGMSGLLSSIIDLEQHQYEVVKRVLQDPVQRYLLADEVGLGKTIEAGVLIRQYVLDRPLDHRVLVIAPAALLVQWRRELRERFLLGDLLGEGLLVLPMDADPERLVQALAKSEMVVIDEAHHLSREPLRYQALREAIIAVPRLLLLSATPVLHNERGFLEMLHLLDPHVHRLEDEEGFRQRIEHRQALAESVAGLVPENLFQIEDFLDDLSGRFPDDTLLNEHAESLRGIVTAFPEETDPEFVGALAKLRAHLTETYRLDRRILRNRRRDLPFLTPKRAGVERIGYVSAALARLIQVAEVWRTAAAESAYGDEQSERAKSLANWFYCLLEAIHTDEAEAARLARSRLEALAGAESNGTWEFDALKEIARAADRCSPNSDRLERLRDLLGELLSGDSKIVVFCALPSTAKTVTAYLRSQVRVPIDRHALPEDPEDEFEDLDWEVFLADKDHRILVCDAAAEEGLNLQGGTKVIVHFDVPLAPNRIEQRLGRADRYGSGNAIRSLALCCDDDPYADRWLTYLDEGLRLFERSVASLQYLIEDEMQVLSSALLYEGVDALDALTKRTQGDDGSAERELRRIDDQDALNALTLPNESETFDALTEIDGDWRGIADAVQQWMLGILQIDEERAAHPHQTLFGAEAFRFCFAYQDRGTSTLIPLKRLLYTLLGVLDPEAPGAHSRLLKTGWYACWRRAATRPSARSEGTRLVRWGENLIDQIQRFTDLDDRGRAAAMWRCDHDYSPCSDVAADIYIRFDFVVSTNVESALQTFSDEPDPSLRMALARRGDMALAPFYKTLWLDEGLAVVKDEELLARLTKPYCKILDEGGYQDWNVNADRWPQLKAMDMPVTRVWRQWIPEARKAAQQRLRDETDLDEICRQAIDRAKAADETRFAQLRARIRHAHSDMATATRALLKREQSVAEALYEAIRAPRVSLETVVAVFLSPKPMPL